MREPQEVEGLRLEPTGFAVLSGVAAELDGPSLLGMQLQPEALQSLPEIGEEAPSIVLELEAHHRLVGIAHDDDIALRMRFHVG